MHRSLPILLAFAIIPVVLPAEETLRSIAEINAFTEDATPRKVPFELTGKVVGTFDLPMTGEIVLADDSDMRMPFYRALDLSRPEPGDTIEARGVANMSDNHEPYVLLDDFKVLEHGPRPEPFSVRLSELNAREHHLATVRTEGTVIDAFPDEVDLRYMILLLEDSGAVVPVSLPRDLFGDRRDLVDARIRVTGVYHRNVEGVRKHSWPNIAPRTPEDIEVLAPPPKDPFSAPPLENRLYLTSDEIARMSKRTVSGEVLATWAGDRAMLRTGDGRIVNLTLAHGVSLPLCGETVVAVGRPETDLFRINLAAVRWKVAPRQLPPAADEKAVDPATAFWDGQGRHSINGHIHGTLLSARGIVRTLPSADDPNLRFVLDAGDASITVDATSNPAAVEGLRIGSEIRATGRCMLLTDPEQHAYGSAKVRGVAIVLRSPADLVVLRRPSWWTSGRLMAVIAVMLAVIAGGLVWNRALRNLADRRGRELYREQVAHAVAEFKTDERTRLAVELHDSLSQALSGVACHLAVGAGTLEADPAAAGRCLATARKMLDACRTELRQCLFDLRSDTLEERDFSVAIRKTLDQIDGDADLEIRCDVPRQLLMDTTAHAILSILRELTGNAIRHGGATEVEVAGAVEPDRIVFSVRDNGGGFDPNDCNGPAQGHFGLEGIRNRLAKLNGTFTIESAPGAGTKAVVAIPLPAARAQENPKT
jgi:signal transduction histidine kinase